jgi:hypothetical protein
MMNNSWRGVKDGIARMVGAAGVIAAAGAALAGAAAASPPRAPTAFWQDADSEALCCCRQESAAWPPGVTPEHWAMKSLRQADLIAFRCAAVGACADAAGFAGEVAAGAVVPPPLIAATAFWQEADKDALCCCRHWSASRPPGVTLEHWAM